ncbi:MAG: chloride channel protein [Nakamurella sp.]
MGVNSGWYRTPDVRLILATVVTGVLAGLAGIALTLLLHTVQHAAFGYTEEAFLLGVEQASATRRVAAMAIGGAVAGTGWWALWRYSRRFPAVGDALSGPDSELPLPTVTADAALQIIAVGFGASLGREGAPRQVGAALGGWLAKLLRLDPGQRRTVLACGAGAGLAAVYNVPLGGAVFTLEVLLVSARARDVVPAILSSAVAAAVAWPVLGSQPTYLVPPVNADAAILVWAVLLGPVAGVIGVGFLGATSWARRRAPKAGWRLPLATTAVFAAVGALAIGYPALLGNGKGLAQLAFDGTLGMGGLGALLILKPLATAACLGSGARGGLLTPAVATGALLGALTGNLWVLLWPGAPTAAFALIGAAAVLATTQRAPLCAIVLIMEFTHTGLDLLVPMLIAVVGAMLTGRLLRSVGRSGPDTGPIAMA